MKIKTIEIRNFRLLKKVVLSLEDYTTVVVGRNNSGKTSLTEIFRRLIGDKNPTFSLFDFSISSIEGFKSALQKKLSGANDQEIRAEIPSIEIKITIEYPIDAEDLGTLSDFIIDLNVASNTAVILVQYTLKDGKLDNLFEGTTDDSAESIAAFIKSLREKIPNLFEAKIFAQDPNDETNVATMDHTKFKSVIGAGFINAQRGLDDVTHSEKDVLGKVLSQLFKTSKSDSAPEDMKEKSEALQVIIDEIQEKVDTDFNGKLDKLLPALALFGYPGLADPNLSTETRLDVSNILDSHTKIRYNQGDNLFLPETYNGLGSRNLIYILFQLFEFFRQYQSRPVSNSLDIIFIEEPEAHLHPQMQQIFIKKLYEIAEEFSNVLNEGKPWPVQFVVTTHSTHIANEAEFEAIRYFLTSNNEQRETTIKDLRKEFRADELQADKEFLHKYLTLTKCDLYFADKAILIEGIAERLMMPLLISKSDALTMQAKLAVNPVTAVVAVESDPEAAIPTEDQSSLPDTQEETANNIDTPISSSTQMVPISTVEPSGDVAIPESTVHTEDFPTLSTQYISVIEVGGAYAHHFYKFLDFLELRCLVITDIDAVVSTVKDRKTTYPGSLVCEGSHSSNAGIKNWFAPGTAGHYTMANCIAKTPNEKVSGSRRIAYQIPEDGLDGCGRSFEEALILANRELFAVTGYSVAEIEKFADDNAPDNKNKSAFALEYGLEKTDWKAPKYIVEGLQWLALKPNKPAEDVEEAIVELVQ
ncbi:AAA family ATPase [Flavobacterium sp. Fl-318]|uniref:AAA family ATPase n=1 Tax=Flavobacterium cupriresistens TaxID=2893885 RepID=A0ABU4R6E0_9FLAO|nr:MULTISPECIES: AAA family ATPase [unclassified Flavobacterium]MDX6187781.1 AAA family ATPase [Flavobacterium sp. Fl-318]UFH42296.1 ATP-dependent endonuclease [Flavobacterium sp. F-323]